MEIDEHYFLVKQPGAIAAKRMVIATNKTQNNLEATPDDIRKHPDLAKAAILAELVRWTTKNQALRRQHRREVVNLLTSRYVFTWKRNAGGTGYLKCRLTVHGFKDAAVSNLDRCSGTSTRWGQRAVVGLRSTTSGRWHLLMSVKRSSRASPSRRSNDDAADHDGRYHSSFLGQSKASHQGSPY